ncbi:MAG: caspase family protein [Chromatiales bacterium]|nr:caspase family protein [Chromatiales bacterium]
MNDVYAAIVRLMMPCLLLLALLGFGPASAAGRVALLVGNDRYSGVTLRYPINGTRALATRLQSLGFHVIKLENANTADLERALGQFEAWLGPGSLGLFYYAGAAIQAGGKNLLLPTDAHVDGDAVAGSIALTRVIGAMQEGGSTATIVLTDTARDQPFPERLLTDAAGLAEMAAPRHTLIAFAAAPNFVGSDGQLDVSPFSEQLLRALDIPDLTVRQLMLRVQRLVSDISSGQQVPWFVSKLDESITINSLESDSVGSITIVTLEARARHLAKDRGSATIGAFLTRFPDGMVAGLTRERLGLVTDKAKNAATATATAAEPKPKRGPPPKLPSCASIVGVWQADYSSFACKAVIRITTATDGRFKMDQTGCGDVVGRLRQQGRRIRGNWSSDQCRGTLELKLNRACDAGLGQWGGGPQNPLCEGPYPLSLKRINEAGAKGLEKSTTTGGAQDNDN